MQIRRAMFVLMRRRAASVWLPDLIVDGAKLRYVEIHVTLTKT